MRNTRFLRCQTCLDIPNPQLLSYSPGPDSLPVRDPRPRLVDEGFPPLVVYTVAGLSTLLIGANSGRSLLNFTLPAAFGLWLNPTGGSAFPGTSGAVFYAPGSYYEAFGAASQPAMTYYTTIAGLLVVVQSDGGGLPGVLVDVGGGDFGPDFGEDFA